LCSKSSLLKHDEMMVSSSMHNYNECQLISVHDRQIVWNGHKCVCLMFHSSQLITNLFHHVKKNYKVFWTWSNEKHNGLYSRLIRTINLCMRF